MIRFAEAFPNRENVYALGRQFDKSGIRVATYLTEMPPRHLLERKLREMAAAARARLGARPE